MFNFKDNKKDKKRIKDFWGLNEEEEKLIKKGKYDPWNFEEEELEEDDYYYEDDK